MMKKSLRFSRGPKMNWDVYRKNKYRSDDGKYLGMVSATSISEARSKARLIYGKDIKLERVR